LASTTSIHIFQLLGSTRARAATTRNEAARGARVEAGQIQNWGKKTLISSSPTMHFVGAFAARLLFILLQTYCLFCRDFVANFAATSLQILSQFYCKLCCNFATHFTTQLLQFLLQVCYLFTTMDCGRV
jgi:hypothetical protein